MCIQFQDTRRRQLQKAEETTDEKENEVEDEDKDIFKKPESPVAGSFTDCIQTVAFYDDCGEKKESIIHIFGQMEAPVLDESV